MIKVAADAHDRLSGLDLLRAAMQVLPPCTARKIAALSEVPWFEPALAAEVERRAKRRSYEHLLLTMLARSTGTMSPGRPDHPPTP